MAKCYLHISNHIVHRPLPDQARAGCGYLYAIAYDAEGPVKLGITVRPKVRLAELETASGKKLACVFLSPECENYAALEKELHGLLADFRDVGEWFNMPFRHGVRAVETRAFRKPPKHRISFEELRAAAEKVKPPSEELSDKLRALGY